VDPRLELLSIVQWLSGYGEKYPLLTKLEFPYVQAVARTFDRHVDHAAVRAFDALASRPFSYESPPFAYGAPPEVVLYLRQDGTLWEDVYADAFLVNRAGGRESLQSFTAALCRFAQDTRYADFYRESAPTYRAIVQRTCAVMGTRNHIDELERFFGTRQGSYTLILVPLYHSVGYGPNISIEDARHTYNIMGPTRVEDELPSFGSEQYFTEMQRHEFSHSYVNPLTDAHWPAIEAHFDAYASAEEAKEVVNESVIRAVTAWLAYAESADAGDRALQREVDRGFELVPALLEGIRAYASHRDTYPTFESFYPDLIAVFEDHDRQRYGLMGEAYSQA
jgi:hypothetical protein